LRLLVGDQVFDLFASAYIAALPSRSYSLYGLGAGFADFLEATRPEGTGPASIEAIPASLTRLERAMAEAQRAVGTEALPGGDLPGIQADTPDIGRYAHNSTRQTVVTGPVKVA
jgi:hypothetical protein